MQSRAQHRAKQHARAPICRAPKTQDSGVVTFLSELACVAPHPSGWLALPSGVEITRLPLWDSASSCFARLSPLTAAEWAVANGARLPTLDELDALRGAAMHIDAATMPTAEQLAAQGIRANDVPAIDAFRNANMTSLEWARMHDAKVFARLAAKNWVNEPVANAGKHWATGGFIYGWWRTDGTKIQNASKAHANSSHADYATTTHVVRGAATTMPPPLPPKSAERPKSPTTILAKNYTKSNRAKVDWIVLHSTENPVGIGVARNVALWFAGVDAPQASAHYIVGPEKVFQCVIEHDVAWAAPGANATGIQIELVGQAHKTDWTRDGDGPQDGLRVVVRAAELVRAIAKRWDIPLERVDAAGLLAGARGITTHASVGAAFKKSTHVDPGGVGDVRWPWELFLRLIRG